MSLATWASRRLHSARWDYNDPELRSVPAMARRPIQTTMGYLDEGFKDPDWHIRNNRIACTMMHRLCHLIYRMESIPCYETAVASAWYISEMPSTLNIMPPEMWPGLEELKTRLQAALDRFTGGQPIDIQWFWNLVRNTGTDQFILLYGPPLYDILKPSITGPRGRMAHFVCDYMWQQTLVSSL